MSIAPAAAEMSAGARNVSAEGPGGPQADPRTGKPGGRQDPADL